MGTTLKNLVINGTNCGLRIVLSEENWKTSHRCHS